MINPTETRSLPGAERPETWRLFIALPVPHSVRGAICDAQEDLCAAVRSGAVRWTPESQFHLTLKFLGDVAVERVQELCRSIGAVCAGFGELELIAEHVGCFPNTRRPRVVWVGVHDAKDRLPALHHAIEAAVREFTAERPEMKFTGHITLGRAKELSRADGQALTAHIEAIAERRFGVWQAGALELMRSKLSTAGAEHMRVAEFPLSGRA